MIIGSELQKVKHNTVTIKIFGITVSKSLVTRALTAGLGGTHVLVLLLLLHLLSINYSANLFLSSFHGNLPSTVQVLIYVQR